MTTILLQAILAALSGASESGAAALAPTPSILKVDPPSWWPGHSINPVRLVIRGKNLEGAKVVALRSETVVRSSRVNERGTYVFVSLDIDPRALPGDAWLRLETGSGTTLIPFRLEAPL